MFLIGNFRVKRRRSWTPGLKWSSCTATQAAGSTWCLASPSVFYIESAHLFCFHCISRSEREPEIVTHSSLSPGQVLHKCWRSSSSLCSLIIVLPSFTSLQFLNMWLFMRDLPFLWLLFMECVVQSQFKGCSISELISGHGSVLCHFTSVRDLCRKFCWKMEIGTGEMVRHLRALIALVEDPGSITSTYMVSNNCPKL